jgi:adenylate cyclase
VDDARRASPDEDAPDTAPAATDGPDTAPATTDGPAPEPWTRRVATRTRTVARRARELNEHEAVLEAIARTRRRLPGDDRFGDALSTADQARDPTLTRRIARLAGQRSGGAVHELGLGALQVWQAAAERSGRGRGSVDVTIAFTDLVGFSAWALEAGDEATLLLLREVGGALEPAVAQHRGTVVKWLGDGMMAVFREPIDAVRAVEAGRETLSRIEIAGYAPRIRAGIHVGRPRQVGADYLGVDVNIAARVAQAAGTDELLASDAALDALGPDVVEARRRKRFRAKGVPADLGVHAIRSA